MTYDKNSFLSGVAVGRQLKGWAGGGGGIRELAGFGDMTGWTVKPENAHWLRALRFADGVNSLDMTAVTGEYEKLAFRLTGLAPPGSVGVFSFRLTTAAYRLGGYEKDGGFLTQSVPRGEITAAGCLCRTAPFTGAACSDALFYCAAVVPEGELYAAVTFWDVYDGADNSFSFSDVRFRYFSVT